MLATLLTLGWYLEVPRWPQEQTAFPKTLISVEIRGKLLPFALAELSRIGGVQLTADPVVSREPLILKVRSRPFDEVMSKVASALEAEWAPENGRFKLTRSPRLLEKLESERIDREASLRVAPLQAEVRKALAGQPRFDSELAGKTKSEIAILLSALKGTPDNLSLAYRRAQDLAPNAPIARLGDELLCSLDPRAIASLEPAGRMVFSTRPSRLQRRFPPSALQAWRDFQREFADWLDAVKDLEAFYRTTPYRLLPSPFPDAGVADRTPDRAVLVAQREDHFSSIGLRLLVANKAGEVLSHWERTIDGTGLPALDRNARESLRGKALKPIRLSPMSQELAAHFRRVRNDPMGSFQPAWSEELSDVMRSPHLRDPAELFLTDFAFATAEDANVNVVVAPSWWSLMPGLVVMREDVSVESFLTQIGARWMGVRGQREGNWLVLKPASPFVKLRECANREELARLLTPYARTGLISLDDLGEFAARHSAPSALLHFHAYFLVFAKTTSAFDSCASDSWVRLHGLLSKPSREALVNGAALPVRDQGPAVADVVRKIVFDRSPWLETRQLNPAGKSLPSWTGAPLSLLQEPTESFPGGLPPDAALRVEAARKSLIWTTNAVKPEGYKMLQPVDVARMLAGHRNVTPDYGMNLTDGSTKLRVESRRTLTYFVELGGGLYVSGELWDQAAVSPWVDSWEQLPKDVVDEVRQELAKLKPPGRSL